MGSSIVMSWRKKINLVEPRQEIWMIYKIQGSFDHLMVANKDHNRAVICR